MDGAPSKNPRYLQTRPDLQNPRARLSCGNGHAVAATHCHLRSRVHPVKPYCRAAAIIPPEDPQIRSLAVFNPIHYLELPELFMEFICSMTGKSPSTTGAGSEGALTKGPFNALPPIIDLNNALVALVAGRP